MGYCAVADVEGEFKGTPNFAATGALVTSATVTQMIAEASALVDAYVGQRYQTPIVGTSALALASLWVRTLVGDRVRGILENKQQTNIDANANVKAMGYTTANVIADLKRIRDNEMDLQGATLLNPNSVLYSNNNDQGITPKFQKDVRQW